MVAERHLGAPNAHLTDRRRGDIRFGRRGSFSVTVEPHPKAGVWYDFEAGVGGGAPSLEGYLQHGVLEAPEGRAAGSGHVMSPVVRSDSLDYARSRYYLSNAPEDTPLETLAYVGGSRWRIETEFETEKSDVGLDEYETRTWAGWHHHVALCLLGGAFLLSLQQDWGEKDAPDHPAAGVPGGT